MAILSSFSSFLSFLLVLALFFCGFYLLWKTKFFIFLHPSRTLRLAFNKIKPSQVKALLMSLGGTLGVGNISGVALAIICGGAGSVFWMWISAVVVMIIKYAEVTLGQRYRTKTELGYEGTALNYIERAYRGRGVKITFWILSLVSSFSIGALIQANAIADSVRCSFGKGTFWLGAALAISVFLISVYCERSLSSILSFIVPLMSVMYIIMSVCVIFCDLTALGNAVRGIFAGAFTPRAVTGGGVYGVFTAIRYGVSRGLFSNEAGAGTAPISHSTADSDYSARQGIMGIIEVFFDTVVMCTLTALAILCAVDKTGLKDNGMLLITEAMSTFFGGGARILVFISVFFFAFATIILWSYYGKITLGYFIKGRCSNIAFFLLYALTVFFGTQMSENGVWLISDIATALMTLINVGAIIKLSSEVVDESRRFSLMPEKR